MSQRCGNTFLTTIVESYHTTVGKGKLDLTLTLLTGNLSRHRTVNLVGEPVLAGHSLQLQHPLKILIHFILSIFHIIIFALHGLVNHHCLG